MKRSALMIFCSTLILVIALSACAPQPPPTPDPTLVSAIVDATVRAIPTATPPSTPTPQVPTAVPPTPIPPTPTVLPNDPALIFGAPDGSDDFSSDRNWSSFDNNCYRSGVTNGQFMMEGKGQPGLICWQHSWASVQNFYADTLVTNPQSCRPNDRYGLYIRGQSETQGYVYGLACDGRFFLTKVDGSTATAIVPLTANPTVRVGPGLTNVIGIAANNGTYQLYINGINVANASDYTFTNTGWIGFFIQAASDNTGTPFMAFFDNLRVWLLPRPQ